MLKIHSDIIKDFHRNYDYIKHQLIKLKKYYNFKIWEDRKFADIGSVMRKQVTMHISEWADIISVHPIAGQDSLDQLNIGYECDIASDIMPTKIEIILIAEMSSSGHLMTEEYQQQVINIAYNTNNVIGIVAQHPIIQSNTQHVQSANSNSNSNSKPLYIVPGISLDKKSDNQGQNYNSPDKKQFADVYVIGRGIYEAEERCWHLNNTRLYEPVNDKAL